MFYLFLSASLQEYTYPADQYHIICNHIHCEEQAEVTLEHGFPGTNRILFLESVIPLMYLSLDIDSKVVFYQQMTISANENYGAQTTIVPAVEEPGWYIIMGNKKICGHGPYTPVYACPFELLYSREAIWYITKSVHGYHIKRGNMCITRVNDPIGYQMTEAWSCQLRRCTPGNPDQIFGFEHVDNFYM